MEMLLSLLSPLLEIYGPKVPWLITILATIGGLRIFLKPIFSLVDSYVMFTKKESDNEFWAKLQENKIFKAVIYCLDWFGSIKVKK